MFIGKAYHQIDDKGRIRMPVKFKEQLGPTPVIMQAPDNVLRVYSYSVAESIFNSLSESADITDLNANDAQTLVSGNSEIVEEDKQGRLLLTKEQIAYAKLVKDIAIVGSINHVEIWDLQKWLKHVEESQSKVTFEKLRGQK